MLINKIKLYNFGSYEGEVVFNTEIKDGRNIILIGGKNGAGKTTLFTAMRLCLYGYMSMGYKAINAHYTKAIRKLINNTAKMQQPVTASVEMEIVLSNGQEYDVYTLCRKWTLNENVEEHFSVRKNNEEFNEKSIADFEKYILSLIPPELFDLYFFDGEKIADFFMEEGSNARIKDAFLTLCGYDTFEIMRKNFKRINGTTGGSSDSLQSYLTANERYEMLQSNYQSLQDELVSCRSELDECEAAISALDKDYANKGGITQEEYSKLVATLREEEKTREQANLVLKKWANEIVPFIMIRGAVSALKTQIEKENDGLKYKYFSEVLDAIQSDTDIAVLKEKAALVFPTCDEDILDLSIEQKTEILAMIHRILDFDISKIERYKKGIKKSIARSAKIRSQLDSFSLSGAQEYMQRKTELLNKKSELLDRLLILEKEIVAKELELKSAKEHLIKMQQSLESELKKQSINDISAKAIVMLDKLQKILYQNQISKVVKTFKKEIAVLIRKSHFIDDIDIDNSFNIHIFRNIDMRSDELYLTVSTHTEQQLLALWGEKALAGIKDYCQCEDYKNCEQKLRSIRDDSITLPVELDKTSLSAGEKQIFIMALYHSLVSLCDHEVPFIIDTPFARIDTDHRRNISKHFFSKLNGQVFILSTDEEIDSEHVRIMNDRILATYLLENADNKRTTVISDRYFMEG